MSQELEKYMAQKQRDVLNAEMEKTQHSKEFLSLKGAFFSTVVLVGGAIALWTGVLITLFLMRF